MQRSLRRRACFIVVITSHCDGMGGLLSYKANSERRESLYRGFDARLGGLSASKALVKKAVSTRHKVLITTGILPYLWDCVAIH